MWRIFCLACCCPGEACFSNAFTSVSAQAGTSKNHPSKRQMTEMKWSLLHLTDSEKTFLLSHASLISPSSTLSPVRTTRSGWGHSTGRTCQVFKGETTNWIIKMHPIAKHSQLSSQNTHCPSKELVFMAFCHLCLGFWTWKPRSLNFRWQAPMLVCLDQNSMSKDLQIFMSTNKESSEDFATEPLRGEIEMPRLKLLVSPELHVFGLRVNLSDVTVCCCELSQCREAWFQLSHYRMCPSVVVGRFRNRSGRLLERLTVAAESEKRRIATVFRDECVESVLPDLHDYII